jgi:hypothetical protein
VQERSRAEKRKEKKIQMVRQMKITQRVVKGWERAGEAFLSMDMKFFPGMI